MAHRRALARRRGWVPWLLVSVALTLDGVTALDLRRAPAAPGPGRPEASSSPRPSSCTGRSPSSRSGPDRSRCGSSPRRSCWGSTRDWWPRTPWSSRASGRLPAPAALRLAHRWSPLIPLLQLIWVPLLALPLARLVQAPAPRPPPRGGAGQRPLAGTSSRHAAPSPVSADVPEPDRDLAGEPSAPAIRAPVAAVETMRAACRSSVVGGRADGPAHRRVDRVGRRGAERGSSVPGRRGARAARHRADADASSSTTSTSRC